VPPVCVFIVPTVSARRFTQVLEARHSGRDAGIQLQGCESPGWHIAKSNTCTTDKLPSMALDSGIPAGMTVFLFAGTCV